MSSIPIANLAVEGSVYVFAAICLWRAWLRGRTVAFAMVAAMVFSAIVEWQFVTGKPDPYKYTYGAFLIMVAGKTVPAWVAVGWGMIVFATMQTSDRSRIPWWARPLADGLLAMNIDLSLDPVAEQLDWWHWIGSPPHAYYHVPWDNFLGWIMIVSSFSFAIRLGYRIVKPGSKGLIGDLAVPVVAALLAFVLAMGIQSFNNHMYGLIGEVQAYALLTGLYAVVVIWLARGTARDNPVDWWVLAVPIYFHLFCLAALLATQAFAALPSLTIVTPILLVSGYFAWGWPSLDRAFGEPAREEGP